MGLGIFLQCRNSIPFLKIFINVGWVQVLCAFVFTYAHFGQDQICTQGDEGFSLFGHPPEVNAS